MKPLVLLVDDHEPHAEMLTLALESHGFAALSSTNGADAFEVFRSQPVEAVVLDVRLRDESGLTLCRKIRDVSGVPIIVLSALRNESDIVAGLEAGANDYVTKPFSVPELVARLRSHLRTSIRRNGMRRIEIPVGDLVIDVDARRVCRSGEDLRLSPTEYRLLTCLAENMGSVVSHDTLAAAIWERDGARLAPHLKIYVRRLRQKIEVDPANPRVIQSRHGAGYLIAKTAS